MKKKLGDNCIVFDNFTALNGDLMVAHLYTITDDYIRMEITVF
jgi:hypothetical protein